MTRILCLLIVLFLLGIKLIVMAETTNDFASSKLISIAEKGVLCPNVKWKKVFYNSKPVYGNDDKIYQEVFISYVSKDFDGEDIRYYYEKYFKKKGWRTSLPCGGHGCWGETFTFDYYTVIIEYMPGGTSFGEKPVVDGDVIQILFEELKGIPKSNGGVQRPL
ncbi:MAG: hypothetical protein ABRQ39_32795 [Candidatus Eremiobacterota bacterium]